jgi:hypothetical protein
MSLIKFRISWEEDDASFRDMEILSAQSFYELHEGIKKHFQLPAEMEASIYVSDDRWIRGREISSTVEKNLRDAPALSMKKTAVGALMLNPDQKFVYQCVHAKSWVFLLDTLTLLPDPSILREYPICVKSEGISPSQLGLIPTEKDSVVEIEERYDLASRDGFGDEGDDEDLGLSEEAEEGMDSSEISEDF